MKVQAYLTFDGNCQEALNFYGDLFDAQVENRITYKDQKVDVPNSFRDKLQHAELKGKGVHFMAYDASPDTPIKPGNQVHMSVDLNKEDKAKEIFKTLSNKGIVQHEFREREWGLYGRCTDQFGINWMVNCKS